MKKIAVITDATSAGFYFPAWHRYYSEQFGAKNLHVVTYEGMKPLFAEYELGNLWEINAKYDDTLRAAVISDLVTTLLRSNDIILRCDVDEFLVPDPARWKDLKSYVEENELPYVTAHGIDVVEVAEEAPLDMSLPLLGGQRRFGMRAAALNKTALTTIPLRWAEGFHGATVPPIFAGLYNLHMKFADLRSRISWFELMSQEAKPDSHAQRYFSVGEDHLRSIHNFIETRPREELESEKDFEARFLASVTKNEINGIYQGEFIRQDFLIQLDRFIASKNNAISLAYDGLILKDLPPEVGVVRNIETPSTIPNIPPIFVIDSSNQDIKLPVGNNLNIHGSDLVRYENVLLFGPNNLVTEEGFWACEARTGKEGFINFYTAPFYDPVFPGPKPKIKREEQKIILDISHLKDQDISIIDDPVFLATPLEPGIWGRWITCVTAKIQAYKKFGGGRRFMCHMTNDWEKNFLKLWGVPEHVFLPHDPGKTYLLHDVLTVEFSEADLRISPFERISFYEMVARHHSNAPRPQKLFVSRLSRSKKYPHYRVLQNELELATELEKIGFYVFEPELFSLEEQIAIFSKAREIIFVGGSAIFNAAFCAPDARIITIEASARYAPSHAAFLASLGLQYGVIFGKEDLTDEREDHKRWVVDLNRVMPIIRGFFNT